MLQNTRLMILVNGWRRTLQQSLVLEVCRDSIADDPCHLRTVKIRNRRPRLCEVHQNRKPMMSLVKSETLPKMAFVNHCSTKFLGAKTDDSEHSNRRFNTEFGP